MGVFNPEPSLTSEAFWAERIFPTHPPSEASAPPERQRGVLRWLLLETVPDHIPKRFGHWPRAVADLKTKFSDFAPYFLRPFRTIFGPHSEEIRTYFAPSWPRAVAVFKTKFPHFAPYFARPFPTTFFPRRASLR